MQGRLVLVAEQPELTRPLAMIIYRLLEWAHISLRRSWRQFQRRFLDVVGHVGRSLDPWGLWYPYSAPVRDRRRNQRCHQLPGVDAQLIFDQILLGF